MYIVHEAIVFYSLLEILETAVYLRHSVAGCWQNLLSNAGGQQLVIFASSAYFAFCAAII